MRLLSFVEASTVTGPVKPLLLFSDLARRGIGTHAPIIHSMCTTVRRARGVHGGYEEIVSAADAAGIELDLLPERFRFDPLVLQHLVRCIRARAPDVVETHDCKCHFLMWLLRRMAMAPDVPWVAFHHGYTRTSFRVAVYQQLDRLTLRSAARVITVCRPFADDLAAKGVRKERIEVISNAIAPRDRSGPARLLDLRRALNIGPRERVILTVGRLSKEKGHADLITAFRNLVKVRSIGACRLILVGEGGERMTLSKQASDLNDQVLFVGHQADPWPYFCMADIFALPSHTEGSPLVLFEAMAAGLPIVATAVGGVPEAVRNGETALLVPPMDTRQLADAMAALLEDRVRAFSLGRQARQAALMFSPEAYAHRLLNIYDKVRGGEGLDITRPKK